MTEQINTPQAPAKAGTPPLLWVLLAAVLVAALVSCVFAYRTNQDMKAVLAEAGVSSGETREDDVTIMGDYVIRSTLPISDAYKSGDDSKLDSKEKETLEMASAVLDEIVTEDMTDYEKELAVYEWMTHEL